MDIKLKTQPGNRNGTVDEIEDLNFRRAAEDQLRRQLYCSLPLLDGEFGVAFQPDMEAEQRICESYRKPEVTRDNGIQSLKKLASCGDPLRVEEACGILARWDEGYALRSTSRS
ncbi:hypothetical protein PABG_11130 [Paracoccidioides brasiliensis Pb03]|nr:hypothetical protein PABG_11130 [Paracoccidioides brasiliensis Pb03]